MNELVSVVVPVYNVERYVARCLNSLLRQTYHNIEIVVINDGSTDDSYKICQEIAAKDSRIRLFTQENKGLAAVRNRTIAEARGEYIAFLDSDDLFAPTFVEETLRISKEYHVDIVQTGFYSFLDDRTIPDDLGPEVIRIINGTEACHALFDATIEGIGVSVKFYHRRVLEHITFPEGKLHEDDFVVYKILYEAEKIAVTNRKLYHYQSKRPDSITHAPYTLQRLDGVEAARERREYFLGRDGALYDKANAALLDLILFHLDIFARIKKEDPEKYPAQIAGRLREEAGLLCRELRHSSHLRLRRKINLGLHTYFPAIWRKLRS